MKVDIKVILDLMLLNYKNEKEHNKNIDEVNGYLSCIEDITELVMLRDLEGLQHYKDQVIQNK